MKRRHKSRRSIKSSIQQALAVALITGGSTFALSAEEPVDINKSIESFNHYFPMKAQTCELDAILQEASQTLEIPINATSYKEYATAMTMATLSLLSYNSLPEALLTALQGVATALEIKGQIGGLKNTGYDPTPTDTALMFSSATLSIPKILYTAYIDNAINDQDIENLLKADMGRLLSIPVESLMLSAGGSRQEVPMAELPPHIRNSIQAIVKKGTHTPLLKTVNGTECYRNEQFTPNKNILTPLLALIGSSLKNYNKGLATIGSEASLALLEKWALFDALYYDAFAIKPFWAATTFLANMARTHRDKHGYIRPTYSMLIANAAASTLVTGSKALLYIGIADAYSEVEVSPATATSKAVYRDNIELTSTFISITTLAVVIIAYITPRLHHRMLDHYGIEYLQ